MPEKITVVDRRTIRATGKFKSRKELKKAVSRLKLKGLNNEKIGKICQISASSVSRIKNGDKTTYPQKKFLLKCERSRTLRLNQLWPAIDFSFIEQMEIEEEV